ncbi:MAG: TolC family protein [Bryobacteraceae bacterium]
MSIRSSFLFVPLVCAAAASAQTPLTLAEAVNRALSINPQLQTSASRIEAAAGLRDQAALRPNPKLFLQSENTRFYNLSNFSYSRDTDNFLYFSQMLETAGKRGKRREAGAAGVRLAELDQQVLRRQIATRVALAYWAAAGASRVRDLLGQDVQNFQRIVDYHRNRVQEGAMPESDLIRIELESQRLKVALENAVQDAERTRIMLFREMGETEYREITFTEPLEKLRTVDSEGIAGALATKPEILASRQAVEQARANLVLEQARAKPDPEVLLGYKRTNGFNTVIAGLQVSLPFWNRNQGEIAAAHAEIRGAEAAVASTEAGARAEIEAALTGYEARRKLVTETLPPMRQRAAETARISEAVYREGATDLLRLLDAERTRIETEVLYYRTLTEFQQSVVALESALGVMP